MRIIRQIQHVHGGGFLIRSLFVREEFLLVHFAHIVVAELVEVVLDVCRSQRRVAAGEQAVDVVPRQQCAVLSVGDVVAAGCFGEKSGIVGRACQHPVRWLAQVDAALRTLKVVDIRCVLLQAFGMSRNEVGEFYAEIDTAGGGGGDERQFVQHVRQPLAFFFPGSVQSPQSV